ncbi:uncharacterized [Tachysurus ichikawai]
MRESDWSSLRDISEVQRVRADLQASCPGTALCFGEGAKHHPLPPALDFQADSQSKTVNPRSDGTLQIQRMKDKEHTQARSGTWRSSDSVDLTGKGRGCGFKRGGIC